MRNEKAVQIQAAADISVLNLLRKILHQVYAKLPTPLDAHCARDRNNLICNLICNPQWHIE